MTIAHKVILHVCSDVFCFLHLCAYSLPEGIVLKTFTGDDEMDGLTVWTTENTPSLLDENRQLKDQVTRTNSRH